jgi:chemotaxis protein MotB
MKRLPIENPTGLRDRWMASYVDVLTILLVFFLIAAASTAQKRPETAKPATPEIPAPKAPVMPAAPVAPAAPRVPAVSPRMQQAAATSAAPTVTPEPAKDAPEQQPPTASAALVRARDILLDRGLDPKLEARGLLITLPQPILFPSGGDQVSPQALPAIEKIAFVLRGIPNPVRLIGYADSAPVHNRRFTSNWDLSMARCRNILSLLTRRYGIDESRLSIASYGPYRPVAPNDTAYGRAANRRVEILILDERVANGPETE